ncbi:ABC transporter substrate-binding protein [Corticibacterium sp. UT-5YL-CI-8]|nr:ABC transporter substrate-binding protein [Tianweitania sp. UT-5YL-CI-8]
MIRRRQFLGGAAALAGASMSYGLTRRASAQDSSKVLKFVPQADLAVVDPFGSPAYVTRNHAMMVYDTLYGVDSNFKAQPQMVEGHTTESDDKIWKMTLRPGQKFHDGEPVLGKDVAASLKRWLGQDSFSQALAPFVDEISAPDDKTVQFRLNKPFPMLPDALGKVNPRSTGIMPERIAAADPTKPITEIIGSGPFRYVAAERVAGSLNVYEKFADYIPRSEAADNLAGGKVVHFDRVEWHTIPDPATAAAALQAGEIDWWEQPTPDLLQAFTGNSDIRVAVTDKTGNLGILRFNFLQKPFDNPQIRKILLNVVRQSDFLIAAVGEDPSMWQAPVGIFHPNAELASTEGLETFTKTPDLEKAKADLIAAGYKGERVVIISTGDYPVIGAFSEVAADLFRKVGLNVDLQVQDWATVAQRMKNKGDLDSGGYSVYCNFIAGAAIYNTAGYSYLRSNADKAFDGWPDIPEIEVLRAEWLSSTNAAERPEIGRKIQQIALEKVPFVPLGLFYYPTAYRSDLTGMLDAMPLFWNVRRA